MSSAGSTAQEGRPGALGQAYPGHRTRSAARREAGAGWGCSRRVTRGIVLYLITLVCQVPGAFARGIATFLFLAVCQFLTGWPIPVQVLADVLAGAPLALSALCLLCPPIMDPLVGNWWEYDCGGRPPEEDEQDAFDYAFGLIQEVYPRPGRHGTGSSPKIQGRAPPPTPPRSVWTAGYSRNRPPRGRSGTSTSTSSPATRAWTRRCTCSCGGRWTRPRSGRCGRCPSGRSCGSRAARPPCGLRPTPGRATGARVSTTRTSTPSRSNRETRWRTTSKSSRFHTSDRSPDGCLAGVPPLHQATDHQTAGGRASGGSGNRGPAATQARRGGESSAGGGGRRWVGRGGRGRGTGPGRARAATRAQPIVAARLSRIKRREGGMSAMRTFTSAPARLTRESCGGRRDARGTPRARIGVRSGRIDMGELGRRRRPGRGVTSRRIEVDLTARAVEQLVDQVARRVVEILRDRRTACGEADDRGAARSPPAGRAGVGLQASAPTRRMANQRWAEGPMAV